MGTVTPSHDRRVKVVLGLIVAVLALLAPLVLSPANLTVYMLLGTAAMVTVGVSLLMGYAGQVSLGQAAFFGIGGYTAALMTTHGLPSALGLICAPFVAALLAALVGIPIMRLRGHYLAFATLAFQLIMLSAVGQIDFFGGDIGLQGIPQLGLGGAELSTARSYAWLTWAGVAIVMLITRNIIASRPGRGLRALATSETAAESSGVPVARYRITVFALSAGFARAGRGHLCLLNRLYRPGLVPGVALLRVRRDGGDRRPGNDLGAAGRCGHHHCPGPGAQQPGNPARDALLRIQCLLVCGLPGTSDRGASLPPARPAAGRDRAP